MSEDTRATQAQANVLSFDDIKKKKHKPELLEIPEWNGSVYVRGLTGKEKSQLEKMSTEAGGEAPEDFRWKLAAMGLCDENGDRYFKTDEDAEVLADKDVMVLDRIIKKIMLMSGLTESEVGELSKNSSAAPGGDSTSD